MLESDGTVSQGEGVAYGVDTFFRLEASAWSSTLSTTWSRSWRREDPDDDWTPHRHDQPWWLTHVTTWRLGPSLSLATRFRFGSGAIWDGETETVYDLLTQTEVAIDPNQNDRLGSYHSLDVKASRRVYLRTWELDLYLDLQNLYDRRVPEPVISGLQGVEDSYGFGLPRLLVFGVKAIRWPSPVRPEPRLESIQLR